MKKGLPKPKLAKTRVLDQQGFAVYTVNAFAVRDMAKADEEFTNFATHGDFPDLIKTREIWIDERLFESEGLFYLANALTRLKAQGDGTPEERAYVMGLNVERALRERLVGVKYRAGRPHKRVPTRLYRGTFATLPDVKQPVQVRLVDGNLARSFYKTDYTEGGHGYVYPWVPKAEIWVEHDLATAEIPYIVAHEYLELRLMRDRHLEYDRAHEICARVEFALRKGEGIQALLTLEKRAFTREDLPGLCAPAVFEYVVKHHVKTK